jgi:hypothetical protein
MKTKLLLLACVCLINHSANAAVLLGWDFSTLTGGSGNFGATPYVPGTIDSDVSAVGLTRNHALGTGSGAANAWGANNFNIVTPSEASAITASNFFTFSITPDPLIEMSFDSIGAYNIRRSSSGPTTGQWQYQIGAGSFVDIGSDITWGTTTTSAGNAQSLIDLSGISALQSVTDTVTFRLIAWGATTTGGTFYFNDPLDTTANDLVINGTVAAIPEPSRALLFGIGSIGLIFRRRRQ